jgi:Tol biopolymer transport system component
MPRIPVVDDGKSLGFFVDGGLKIAEAFGTGPVRSVPAVRGGSYGAMWCPDGRIVLGTLERTGLVAHSVVGGAPPTQVTTLDAVHGEGGQLYPRLLPDGRHFLYLSEPSSTIWLASLDSKETRQILAADSQALYAAPGYLLFLRGQTLYAQRFDAERLTTAGGPIALAVGVLAERSYGGDFSVSSTGMLAYRVGTIHVPTQLTWVDRAGKRLGTLGPPGRYGNIEISKDDTRVVMEALDPRTYTKDIWTIDAAGGVLTQLTFDPGNETFPIWSPDGQWIVFASDRHGGWQLYRRRADGGGGDERVATTAEAMVPQSWAPDGQSMVYLQRPVKLGVLQLNASRDRRLIDAAGPEIRQYLDGYGEVSPDGRWLLYGSNESGPWEVYLRRFPESEGGKWKISDRGAVSPRWRPDGREIFYYSGDDSRIVAVPVDTSGTTPQIGAPTPLFRASLLGGALPAILWRMNYAVSSDGQRFLLDEPLEDAYAKAPTIIMTNWMAALK